VYQFPIQNMLNKQMEALNENEYDRW